MKDTVDLVIVREGDKGAAQPVRRHRRDRRKERSGWPGVLRLDPRPEGQKVVGEYGVEKYGAAALHPERRSSGPGRQSLPVSIYVDALREAGRCWPRARSTCGRSSSRRCASRGRPRCDRACRRAARSGSARARSASSAGGSRSWCSTPDGSAAGVRGAHRRDDAVAAGPARRPVAAVLADRDGHRAGHHRHAGRSWPSQPRPSRRFRASCGCRRAPWVRRRGGWRC